MAQVEKRTAAERRSYFQQYAERKKLRNVETRTAVVSVDARGVINGLGHRYFYNDAEIRRHHLRDESGMMMWPERRHEFPETLEQTLARVR